jgi:hypothetical protein
VSDDTDEHNFHLVGPGVEQATTVSGSGFPTWTVNLQPGGTYRFVCDTHVDFMFGAFQTAAGGGSAGGGSAGGGSSGGGSSGGGSSGGGSAGGGSAGGGSAGKPSTGAKPVALRGTLAGTVTPSGKLKLLFNGKTVSMLKSGRYKITVVDNTPKRSFVVQQGKQPAITVSGVSFTGKHSVTVNLKTGQWTFYTSAGPKSKATFTVVG